MIMILIVFIPIASSIINDIPIESVGNGERYKTCVQFAQTTLPMALARVFTKHILANNTKVYDHNNYTIESIEYWHVHVASDCMSFYCNSIYYTSDLLI